MEVTPGMSNFINKSVNFSQTVLLKEKVLKTALECYNNFLANDIVSSFFVEEYTVPNNGIKYYLFITNKSTVERNVPVDYNIFFFFPDNSSNWDGGVQNNLVLQHTVDEFFMEMDQTFTNSILFEGYMYGGNTFYISDILTVDNVAVSCDYTLRQSMIYEMIWGKPLKYINNHISIGIHPVVNSASNPGLLTILMNNFKFKDSLSAKEIIKGHTKTLIKTPKKGTEENATVNKIIKKSKYADVYNVYDKDTMNAEGILYVKGIKESRAIKLLFKGDSTDGVLLNCTWNETFCKWQPV